MKRITKGTSLSNVLHAICLPIKECPSQASLQKKNTQQHNQYENNRTEEHNNVTRTHTHIHTTLHTHIHTHRYTHTHAHIHTHTHTDRHTHIHTDRQTHKQAIRTPRSRHHFRQDHRYFQKQRLPCALVAPDALQTDKNTDRGQSTTREREKMTQTNTK